MSCGAYVNAFHVIDQSNQAESLSLLGGDVESVEIIYKFGVGGVVSPDACGQSVEIGGKSFPVSFGNQYKVSRSAYGEFIEYRTERKIDTVDGIISAEQFFQQGAHLQIVFAFSCVFGVVYHLGKIVTALHIGIVVLFAHRDYLFGSVNLGIFFGSFLEIVIPCVFYDRVNFYGNCRSILVCGLDGIIHNGRFAFGRQYAHLVVVSDDNVVNGFGESIEFFAAAGHCEVFEIAYRGKETVEIGRGRFFHSRPFFIKFGKAGSYGGYGFVGIT